MGRGSDERMDVERITISRMIDGIMLRVLFLTVASKFAMRIICRFVYRCSILVYRQVNSTYWARFLTNEAFIISRLSKTVRLGSSIEFFFSHY